MGYASDFAHDVSAPRLPSGRVDWSEAAARALAPARQISQNNIALLRLLQAKCQRLSDWRYVTSSSMGAEVGEGVSVGGQQAWIELQRERARGAEAVELELKLAQVGLGLGLSVKGNPMLKELGGLFGSTAHQASGGVLLLGEGRADLEPDDFAGPTVGLSFSGGVIAGTYASALLFGIDAGLRDAFVCARDAFEGLAREQPTLLDVALPAVGAVRATVRFGRFVAALQLAQDRFSREGCRGALLFSGDQAMGIAMGLSVVFGAASVRQVPVRNAT